MIRQTNAQTFGEDALAAPGWTIVDFWAPGAKLSRVQAPILEEFAIAHPEVRVLSVNTERNPTLAGAFKIEKLPALLVFKDGQPLAGGTGLHHTYAITRLLGAAASRAERIPQA
jgi:thioredoxin 1